MPGRARENGQNFVQSKKLKEALDHSGLKPNDNRLQSLFKRLEAHGDKIVFEDFISIIRTSGLLVEKALRGQLALPDFIDFHIGNFHWFIFNVSDIFISLGVLFLIIFEIIDNQKNKIDEKNI